MQEPERREHLWKLVRRLGEGLGVEAWSPIVVLIVGSEAAAVSASAVLLKKGFYVPAIRPPAVAPGTSRSAQGTVLHWTVLRMDHLSHILQSSGPSWAGRYDY